MIRGGAGGPRADRRHRHQTQTLVNLELSSPGRKAWCHLTVLMGTETLEHSGHSQPRGKVRRPWCPMDACTWTCYWIFPNLDFLSWKTGQNNSTVFRWEQNVPGWAVSSEPIPVWTAKEASHQPLLGHPWGPLSQHILCPESQLAKCSGWQTGEKDTVSSLPVCSFLSDPRPPGGEVC